MAKEDTKTTAEKRREDRVIKRSLGSIPHQRVDTTETGGVSPGEQVREIMQEAGLDVAEKPDNVIEDDRPLDRPAGNASEEEWREYRLANGYSENELEDKGRNDLRDMKDR